MRKLIDWFRSTKAASEIVARSRLAEPGLESEIYKCLLFGQDDYFRNPKSLHPHGFKVYSQNEEDGLIEAILARIGVTNRRFVEFGSGEGFENNSIYLLLRGWSGLWIEGDSASSSRTATNFQRLIDRGRLRLIEGRVTPDNVQELLSGAGLPPDFDLLSIDVDGNDYWIWSKIDRFRPRVVVIEYNAGLGPSAEWVMRFDPAHRWTGGRNFGASLKSLELLGRDKGYRLVGCNLTGSNAFFVRADLVGDNFLAPFDSEHHYQPPRYTLRFPSGHPRDPREVDGFPEADVPPARGRPPRELVINGMAE